MLVSSLRRGRAIRRLGGALVLVTILAFARSAGVAHAQTAPVPAQQGTFRIGPSDVLEVVVWRNPDLTRQVTVRPDGYISFPLLNDVQAAGRTPMELRGEIKKRLAEFDAAAEVYVVVAQVRSFNVSVIGKVNGPGRFELRAPTTVLEVLAQAGGLQEYADEDSIFVLRRGPSSAGQDRPDHSTLRLPFDYRKVLKPGGESGNFKLLPNDVVVVP